MDQSRTNRLINETSPYLLQHAHNPVDWFPWGEEAIEKAKREDKVILVSIGYAACHWCHVMERESFENEETARLMNQHFVNIKIDREERPDIDHIYMDAVQAMTGSGGWPLHVFLTHDLKPFFGGTYFPPVKAYNRTSWRDVLLTINHAYRENKHEIESQAEKLTEHLVTSNAFGLGKSPAEEGTFNREFLDEVCANVLKSADEISGGFGKAPKFPQTFCIQFLLRHSHYTGDQQALKHALLSLEKMIYGGIYDHLGGGFARYSTDDQWLAPHFEKMLYDNALLISVLAEAYQITNNSLFEKTIAQTIDFVCREMMSHEGGFFSALDADSEGVEGKFYTWSKNEIEQVLGVDAAIFCAFFDISETGNWEHTNILRITKPVNQFAKNNGFDEEALIAKLENCKALLFAQRSKRVRPQLDGKILLSWNALMIIALSKAYAATGNSFYKEIAIKNEAFLVNRFKSKQDGSWFHTYKNQVAKFPAFLDDLSYLIQALIQLQEITGNGEYLLKAQELAELVIKNFIEDQTGFFFFTAKGQKDVIVRKKELYDGATPSGNSTMALNLIYLSIVFNRTDWMSQATNTITQLMNPIKRYPTSFGNWCCSIQQLVYGTPEIAVTGKNAQMMLSELLKKYIPIRILQMAEEPSEAFPLLEGKEFKEEASIYVCKDYSCQKPVQKIDEIKSLLN